MENCQDYSVRYGSHFAHNAFIDFPTIDLKTILPKAKQNGVQDFIVEQDMVADPEVNLKKSIDYLVTL